jgi:hypothetical protein
VAATKPDELIRELVSDLHRETAADETVEFLRWMYLFMDFEQDLPRLMLMSDAEIKDTPTRKPRDG